MMTTAAAPRMAQRRVRRTVPVGTHTQVLGLTLLALAPITLFAVGALSGLELNDGAFLLAIGAVLALAAVLAARFGTWAKVLGIVLTVLAAVAGFWLAFGLMAPSSPGDFVPAVLMVLGIVLSLYGGVAAVVSRRRGRIHSGPTGLEGRTRLVAVAVVLLAIVASVAINLLARSSVDAAVASGATPVSMAGFEFVPATFTVPAGEEAALLVRNDDSFVHDLSLPDHGLELTLSPGSEGLLDLSSLTAGSYTVYCTLHSDASEPDPEAAGMAATLVIE